MLLLLTRLRPAASLAPLRCCTAPRVLILTLKLLTLPQQTGRRIAPTLGCCCFPLCLARSELSHGAQPPAAAIANACRSAVAPHCTHQHQHQQR